MNITKQNTRRGALAVLLLSAACCLWPAQTSAQQWTTNGNNISNANSGNVGIGTASPEAKLNLLGDLLLGGTTDSAVGNFNFTVRASGFSINGGNGRGLTIKAGDSDNTAGRAGGNLTLNPGSAVSPAVTFGNVLMATSGGNVGVGTATPGFKLDVLGSLNASAGLCIGGTCKSSWAEVGGGSQWANGSSSAISYNVGNVGIGTATPAAKLDVIQANATAIRALSGSAGAHANVQLGRAAPEFSLGVAASPGQYATDSGAGDVIFRTEDPGRRLLFSNGPTSSGLTLAGNKVGVGTATPGFKLDVAGSVNASGLCLAGSCKSNWSEIGTSHWSANGSNISYSAGNVSIGTGNPPNSATKLHVQGNVHSSGDITADGSIAAKYQDVAEWVPSGQRLAAGTVVVLDVDKNNHVLASTSSYDTKVAGVVSAQPGLILGQGGEGRVMVATTGRVRVKADATRAPIKVGDLLVTSEVEGTAMKSEPVSVGGRKLHAPGTIIGKALEPLEKGVGEILVLLSLQ